MREFAFGVSAGILLWSVVVWRLVNQTAMQYLRTLKHRRAVEDIQAKASKLLDSANERNLATIARLDVLDTVHNLRSILRQHSMCNCGAREHEFSIRLSAEAAHALIKWAHETGGASAPARK